MKKSYFKVIIREIKQSFGRFAAIFGIVLLGVGLLFGLMTTTPLMEDSVDKYYRDNNMMDINLKSTLGFSEGDLEAIESLDYVDSMTGLNVMDVITNIEGEVIATRIYGLAQEENPINKLTLLEGRLPKEDNEVLVERSDLGLMDIQLGQLISISEDNEDIDDIFNITEFEVVGIVSNPAYFSKESEVTTIGSGYIGAILYGKEDIYDMDSVTDIQLRVAGVKDMNAFSDKYHDEIEIAVEDLEELGEERGYLRYEEIVDDARAEIQEARQEAEEEIEEARLEALEEIEEGQADGRAEIEKARADAEREIEKGQADGRSEIAKAKSEAEAEIDRRRNEAAAEIEKNRADAEEEIEKERLERQEDLDNGRAEGEAEIERNRVLEAEKIEAGRAAAEEELKSRIAEEAAQIEEALELIDLGLITDPDKINEIMLAKEQLDTALALGQIEIENSIQEAYDSLDAALNEEYVKLDSLIQAGQNELDAGIAEAKAELDKGIEDAYSLLDTEIGNARIQLDTEIQDAYRRLDAEISNAYSELDSEIEKAYGELDSEIEKAYLELDEEIDKAYAELEEEIQDAEEELEDLADGEWFVLDRNSNISFVTFELNYQKIDAIIKVFPVFFYLVAALVALTTMTRMVEEERVQIGTLKALGYSRITVVTKYIIYCGLASLLGSIAGLTIGLLVLPRVIWNAFDSLMHLPELQVSLNVKLASISSGVAILGNILVTIYVCNNALRENAASLMQPKAPKPGKRILLERVNPIWSRLSFNQKATIRNIFRYKKHFFMTVIGIAGCMALLVTGFGLRDSISDLGSIQFDEIIDYSLVVNFEDDSEDIYEVLDRDEVLDSLELHTDKGTIKSGRESEDISIISFEDIEDIKDFVNFRDRKTQDSIQLEENSIIITEKITENFNLGISDSIKMENFDGDDGDFKINAITENYIGNNLYLNHESYEAGFGEDVENNTIYVKLDEDMSEEDKEELINELLKIDKVLEASLVANNRGAIDNLLDSIDYIVLVIILASGALAFIVLYNLTNININERKKELATFRVLGFYNEEVSAYIFRETAILTIIGILVGLGLGTILHRFIIYNIEDPGFMFGRSVKSLSYGLSSLITIVFALLVNLFMSKKIKNIKMADSMKAND